MIKRKCGSFTYILKTGVLSLLFSMFFATAQQVSRNYEGYVSQSSDSIMRGQDLFSNENIASDDGANFTFNPMSNDWFWQNPKPQGNDLSAVQVLDDGNVRMLGANGTNILAADDGTILDISYFAGGFNGIVLDVCFLNNDTGFAVGNSGTILRTADGGINWESIPSGSTKSFNSIAFASPEIGVIVAAGGNMYRTTNGGQDWEHLPIVTQAHLYGVTFVNNHTGIAVGYGGIILKTTDAGETWYQSTYSYPAVILYSVCSVDSNTIISVGGDPAWGYDFIIRSSDGGDSWTIIDGATPNMLFDVSFVNNNRCIAVGMYGLILLTTDGGITWFESSSGVATTLTRVNVNTQGKGFAVGLAGEILYTQNSGTDWIIKSERVTSEFLTGITYIDENVGSAVGDAATILRTTDGGDSWYHQTPPSGTGQYDHYHGVSFANELVGNAVGVFGLISRTTDGGNFWDWQLVRSNDTTFLYTIYAVSLLNSDTGLVAGDDGIIAKLKPEFNYWKRIHHGKTSEPLYGVQMVNSSRAYAVGDYGTILRSTSSGVSWEIQTSNTTNTLWSVHFTSPDVGTAVGSSGTILRTTNGGSLWVPQTSGTTANLFGVRFFNNSCGFAIGSGGTILWTFDGGTTWELQNSNTSHSLRGISVFDTYKATVTGGGGSILNNPDVPVSVEELPQNLISDEFILEQNYPNPFNPSTTIRFNLPDDGFISLKVYNTLGQEITTLYEGELESGYHSIQWNGKDMFGENVTSGIYFYNMTVRNNSSASSSQLNSKTGKMMLLK